MNKMLIVLFVTLILCSCTPTSPANNQALQSGVQTVRGTVVGGGDQTPEGLLDAPREFIYQVKLDSGEEINVTYTAYPPSPVREDEPGPQLTFHAGQINVGDMLTARGTYDAAAKTLTVALPDDFIETTAKP